MSKNKSRINTEVEVILFDDKIKVLATAGFANRFSLSGDILWLMSHLIKAYNVIKNISGVVRNGFKNKPDLGITYENKKGITSFGLNYAPDYSSGDIQFTNTMIYTVKDMKKLTEHLMHPDFQNSFVCYANIDKLTIRYEEGDGVCLLHVDKRNNP